MSLSSTLNIFKLLERIKAGMLIVLLALLHMLLEKILLQQVLSRVLWMISSCSKGAQSIKVFFKRFLQVLMLSQLLHLEGRSLMHNHLNWSRFDLIWRSVWLNRAISYATSDKLMERKSSVCLEIHQIHFTWMAMHPYWNKPITEGLIFFLHFH